MTLRAPSARLVAAFLAAALAACAHRPPAPQTVEVRVDADDPRWAGPLACEAVNAAGKWAFTAPGSVAVLPSDSPLQIICATPAGARAEPSVTPPAAASARERGREGAATGAKIGVGAGVVLGAATAPVLGPAIAVLMVAGSAMKGAEIGGAVAATTAGEKVRYPGVVILRIRAAPPPG